MVQAWFDPRQYAWIPGTALGCVAVLMAVFVVWLVPRGRAKALIIRSWCVLWGVAIVLFIAGVFAWLQHQPWGVWYGLLLPGGVGTAVLGGNLMIIIRRYRQVEQEQGGADSGN